MATKRVMISMPQEFLAEIDRVAEEERRTRSELLREAARFYIQAHQTQHRPIDDPRVRWAVDVQDELARMDKLIPGWDSTAEIRRWRERNGGK